MSTLRGVKREVEARKLVEEELLRKVGQSSMYNVNAPSG